MPQDSARTAAQWQDAVIRAAAEASRLQPLAAALFVGAVLLLVGSILIEPLIEAVNGGGFGWAEQISERLWDAAPAIPLVWALWSAWRYLGRLARGELWGPATMGMLGQVGDALVWAAATAIFIAPTLQAWLHGGVGFDFRLEPTDLALAGLGLLLSLIARVVRNVVEVAQTLKAENDQII